MAPIVVNPPSTGQMPNTWGEEFLTPTLLQMAQAINATVEDLDLRDGNLWAVHVDGTETDLGPLPVGPGGSDAGVAGYIQTVGSQTQTALSAHTVDTVTDALDNPGSPVTEGVQTLIDDSLAGFVPGTPLAKVTFGANPATARPDATLVLWVGDPNNVVQPSNAQNGDIVIYPTAQNVVPAWSIYNVPDLVGYYDATALTTADAGNVTTWPNQVSGGPAANPINSVPVMDIDGINGHRCVQFPNQGVLKTAGYSSYSGAHTIYLVAKGTDTTTTDFFFDAADATPTPLKLAIGRDGATYRLQRGSSFAGPNADVNAHVIRGIFNDTTGSLSIDGGAAVSGAIAAASTTTDYTIGGRADNANKLTGAIGAVVIVRGLVNSSNDAQIVAMLKTKFGIA